MIELARIEFSGAVDDFPAFEMYASVNGTPGEPVFRRMPDPDAGPGSLGGFENPITGSAVIDCFGNPQGRFREAGSPSRRASAPHAPRAARSWADGLTSARSADPVVADCQRRICGAARSEARTRAAAALSPALDHIRGGLDQIRGGLGSDA